MNITGIGNTGYSMKHRVKDKEKSPLGTNFPEIINNKQIKPSDDEQIKDTKTDSDIIVKPDGSRVLVMTMRIGGMKTAMSLELSKPTNIPDNCRSENPEPQGQHTAIIHLTASTAMNAYHA